MQACPAATTGQWAPVGSPLERRHPERLQTPAAARRGWSLPPGGKRWQRLQAEHQHGACLVSALCLRSWVGCVQGRMGISGEEATVPLFTAPFVRRRELLTVCVAYTKMQIVAGRMRTVSLGVGCSEALPCPGQAAPSCIPHSSTALRYHITIGSTQIQAVCSVGDQPFGPCWTCLWRPRMSEPNSMRATSPDRGWPLTPGRTPGVCHMHREHVALHS